MKKPKVIPSCPACGSREHLVVRYPCEVSAIPESWDFQDGRWIPGDDLDRHEHMNGVCLGWDRPIQHAPHGCLSCGWTGDINDPKRTMRPRFLVVLDIEFKGKYKGLLQEGLDVAGSLTALPWVKDAHVYTSLDDLEHDVQIGVLDLFNPGNDESRRKERGGAVT